MVEIVNAEATWTVAPRSREGGLLGEAGAPHDGPSDRRPQQQTDSSHMFRTGALPERSGAVDPSHQNEMMEISAYWA